MFVILSVAVYFDGETEMVRERMLMDMSIFFSGKGM
jgi:hypothetical protein